MAEFTARQAREGRLLESRREFIRRPSGSPRECGPPVARRACPSGFTLLEVMIALAILAVSLVAISGINSGAINMHNYSKRLTLATLLARSKMADLEQKLQSDGLPTDDDDEEGSFEAEGFPEYRWQAQIVRPKTEKLDTRQLLAMTGMGLSGADGKSGLLGSAMTTLPPDVASKIPGGATALTGATSGGPTAGGMGGLLGGAMQSQMQSMLDMLGKAVREVRLTVFWKNGGIVDKFTVVTHVVSLGQGTDQAISTTPSTSGAAGTTGTAIQNAIQNSVKSTGKAP